MDWVKYLYIQILILGVVFCGMSIAWAEDDSTVKFPKTQEEIIKVLSAEPPKAPFKGRGGLRSEGNDSSLFGGQKRGLGGIVDDKDLDDKALEIAPKVGALILFDFDSAAIKDESLPLLREFAEAFQSDLLKKAIFVVAGHTDSKGTDEYNFGLSRRRAQAVKDVLVSKYQIAEHRLIVKPYGESKSIASNDTAQGRAKNRRVEFIRVQ